MHTVLRYDEKPHLLTKCLFATGRSCILHLLRKYDPDVVFIPELYPAGVVDPVVHLNLRAEVYKIKDDFEIDLESLHARMKLSATKRPLIIAIHYFGYWIRTWGAAALAHEFGGILFEDCAHCLPTDDASICGDVRMYSYNKLFPVIDGAIMFSCSPLADLDRLPGSPDLEILPKEALEAYSRHLSANRIIADMPIPKSDFEWARFHEVSRVSAYSYRHYYDFISKDMEPRTLSSLEYLGQYDHKEEKEKRTIHAANIRRRVSKEFRFRDDLPVFAFPVRAGEGSGAQADLLAAGVHAQRLGDLWQGKHDNILLLPLHSPLGITGLQAVEKLFWT